MGRPLAPAEPPLVLTQGDPAGIGPEITLKAWAARREAGLPPFCVLADPDLLAATARRLGLDIPIVVLSDVAAASWSFAERLPVLALPLEREVEPGRPDPTSAVQTIASIERAVALVRSGAARAVVTNPIAKSVLYAAGFAHPGHTEFLAALAAEPGAAPPRPVMMLWSENLAVVPVTIHIPLAAVPPA